MGLLPEGLQVKLLKVIEEREVRRLGSTRSEPVDTWIMADREAAARHLGAAVDAFRALGVGRYADRARQLAARLALARA